VGAVLKQRTAALSHTMKQYLDPAAGSLPQRTKLEP
jgi:hypothetical protein